MRIREKGLAPQRNGAGAVIVVGESAKGRGRETMIGNGNENETATVYQDAMETTSVEVVGMVVAAAAVGEELIELSLAILMAGIGRWRNAWDCDESVYCICGLTLPFQGPGFL
jgi:hypothetical protein